MEQFTTHLEAGMRGWLIGQNPKTLSELSRLADQYVAVHVAERPSRGPLNPRANQFSRDKVKVTISSRKTRNLPRTLVVRWTLEISRRALPTDQKLAKQVFTRNPLCFYCKKILAGLFACHKRQAQ